MEACRARTVPRMRLSGRVAAASLAVALQGMSSTGEDIATRLVAPLTQPGWWREVTVPIPPDRPVSLPEDPGWEDSLTAYGMRFEAEGKGREAIKVLTYALPKCKTPLQRAFVLFQSALIYEVALRDYVRAHSLFGALTRLRIPDPAKQKENNAYARFGQARCLEKLGLGARAKAGYESVLCDYPALDVELLFRLGKVAQARKDRATAERHFRDCIRAAEPRGRAAGSIYYGRFILMSRVALRELASGPIDLSKIANGTYAGKAYGYNSIIAVKLQVQGGRLTDMRVAEQDDKRPFDALRVVPQRIKERQVLDVDAVTGATVTSEAIINAAKQALRGGGGIP